MSRGQAILFAKYPTPGRVNTRLCPPLTNLQAAELHEASLAMMCEIVRSTGQFDLTIAYTPDDCLASFRPLVSVSCDWRPQGNGDLGHRLTRAVEAAFSARATPVVLLGADSPTMPQCLIHEALALLANHDVAVGPSDDGGYYLLGLRTPAPVIFEGIDWGTDRVFAQTLERASQSGLSVGRLESWYDIDRAEDLERAARDMAGRDEGGSPVADRLGRLLERLTREVGRDRLDQG